MKYLREADWKFEQHEFADGKEWGEGESPIVVRLEHKETHGVYFSDPTSSPEIALAQAERRAMIGEARKADHAIRQFDNSLDDVEWAFVQGRRASRRHEMRTALHDRKLLRRVYSLFPRSTAAWRDFEGLPGIDPDDSHYMRLWLPESLAHAIEGIFDIEDEEDQDVVETQIKIALERPETPPVNEE